METKTKEDVSLQVIDSIDDPLEALKLSPFFCTLSEEDLKSIKKRILNPEPIQFVSNRRH